MRLLIAEDSAMYRQVYRQYLHQSPNHFDIDEASTGNDAGLAIEKALQGGRPYDLICLDVGLPDCSGQQVLEMLREAEDSVGVMPGDGMKVIMMTSAADSVNILRAFNGLADAYLVKPISAEAFLAQIERLISHKVA